MNAYQQVPAVILLVLLTLTISVGAQAATFAVDMSTDDATAMACDDSTPNDCSLRGAIVAANARSEASIVNVPAGTYVLSQASTCTYRVKDSTPGIFTSSQVSLCLSKQITIQGAGASATIIDGNRLGYVLFVSADAVAEVRGVTLTNGIGSGILGTTERGGGGIHNHGTLTLTETIVSDNTLPTGMVSYGAGILNVGSLRLHRSVVTNNSAPTGYGGGGIYNNGQTGGVPGGVLTVSDSTISNNTTGQLGGGLFNRNGPATIINSTISGNTIVQGNTGSGGGIANLGAGGDFTGRLTVINSTISGNTAAVAGGGIYIHQLTRVDLNNVTITNNTATIVNGGGGINNYLDGLVNLQNTLIAGNRDGGGPGAAPDCSAGQSVNVAIVSRGYNLIQDAARCALSGDTTSNIIGVDPQLGALLDNGKVPKTHALGDGSPALDAGNPAAPGSGGAACAAIDQRGFNRLQDGDADGVGRCDIGAFELTESAVGFSFSGLRPNVAGNRSSAYALLYGSGFANGMTARLTRAGETDIVGLPPTVDAGGAVAATAFDVTGRTTGPWDVVVTNPDGSSTTLTEGFTVRAGGAPDLWWDVVGPPEIRVGRPARYTLFFGNRGNVDALAVPLKIMVRSDIDTKLNFPIAVPPFQPGQVRTDWSQTPLAAETLAEAPTESNNKNFLLLIPIVPAGFTGSLDFTVTAPPGSEGRPVVLLGSADQELFRPDLDPQLVDDLVAGARAYAEEDVGITIPAELAPDLERYVTNQLAQVVENGRNALIANVGALSQVHSRAWLLVDLARYGAVLAGAQPPAALSRNSGSETGANEPLRVVANVVREVASSIHETIVYLVIVTKAYAQSLVLPEGGSTPTSCESHGQTTQVFIDRKNKVHGPACCAKGITAERCFSGAKCPPPIRSRDPNEKAGPQGIGEGRYIAGDDTLRYVILFENLETASAAAQEVTITDQLDGTKVDLDSLSLGPISFGSHTVTPPPGLSQYSTSVDLRPEINLIAAIDARLDRSTGLLTWRFASLDPLTAQFTEDPRAGFLPPNVNPPEGDGSVLFTIEPKVTGTPICNQASIVFDVNEPILTPTWCNTIDEAAPSSQVSALTARQASQSFDVEWSGIDGGSGIADYSVYVSENGGPFTPFLSDTTETSATFTGELGSRYAFYSVARDLVGNEEAAPLTADATTRVAGGPCIGDCNGDGSVVVSELVTAVRIALDLDALNRCSAADCRGTHAVTIDCLVSSVGAALNGCP